MTISRRTAISLAGGAFAAFAIPRAALAKTVVVVSLWDKGEASMEGMETMASMEGMETMAPMGMAMAGADMAMATMGIKLTKTEVPAGEVSFRVSNDSREFYHNMTISLVADITQELPYLPEARMVDVEAAGVIAHSTDMKPLTSETLNVTLAPGTYILYCNVSGHYAMGMWTLLTVTG